MSLILAECIEFSDNRKVCTASENGKTYRLINASGFIVMKVRVDTCIAQEQGEKTCDYLMSIDNKNFKCIIFIELKGRGLQEALKQLYSTIIYFKNEFRSYKIEARIVGSRDVPGFINTPDYRKLAKQIIPTGGTIERATNKIYEETL